MTLDELTGVTTRDEEGYVSGEHRGFHRAETVPEFAGVYRPHLRG